ncbi:MAG: UDP-diphosphatase, partial [Candidatus Sericytochromatia bacterium]|nr:UDP-diphosphatase [Candidatus Tanganyikabacteria bacterium]
LGLPIMVAAVAYESRHIHLSDFTFPVIVADITAVITGYLSIRFLMRYLRDRSTAVFIVYRLVVGVALIAMALLGHFPGLGGA